MGPAGRTRRGQAVLIDFPGRRFYFFFIEICRRKSTTLTGLLVLAAIALFLMNAVAGRCGAATSVRRRSGPICSTRSSASSKATGASGCAIRENGRWKSRPTSWASIRCGCLIAWWTGGAWVLYFADAPTLVKDLATFNAPAVAWIWIGILTFHHLFARRIHA